LKQDTKVRKLINAVQNKDGLLDKESIIVPIYKKGAKTDHSNYGITLLSTSYKMLSNILLSRLSQYMDEIIRYWRRNGSTMRQYIIKVRKEVLYNNLLGYPGN
jgi:hypothetical protein